MPKSDGKIWILIAVLALIVASELQAAIFLLRQDVDAIVLQERNMEINPIASLERPKSLIFVGDIMLDRSVQYWMDIKGDLYPFERFPEVSEKFDWVVGNLEGPINEQAYEFPDDALKFSFTSSSVKGLLFGGFNLLSLANNHTLNTDEEGLEETRRILSRNNINFVGDPVSCSDDFLFYQDEILFMGINKTYFFNCSEEDLLDSIKAVRKKYDGFFIVMIHWGEEYEPTSNAFQQDLAHTMIDAGVDLIIGHHPHVVQEIEQYKNSLIFYSLGNFVFDQYFSEETQEGLGVAVTIYPHKIAFDLLPFSIDLSQPVLMQEEALDWLAGIAQKSGSDISADVKEGRLEMVKNR